MDHGETGAFLLGRALAGIVDADEMAAVLAFLAMVPVGNPSALAELGLRKPAPLHASMTRSHPFRP